MTNDKLGLSRRALLGAGLVLPVSFAHSATAQDAAPTAYNAESGAEPAPSALGQLTNMTNGSESLNQGFFGGAGGPDDTTVDVTPEEPPTPEASPVEEEPEPPPYEPPPEPEADDTDSTDDSDNTDDQDLSSQYDDAQAEAEAAAAAAAAAATWAAVRTDHSTPPDQYNQAYQSYQQANAAEQWERYKVQRIQAAIEAKKPVIYVLDGDGK